MRSNFNMGKLVTAAAAITVGLYGAAKLNKAMLAAHSPAVHSPAPQDHIITLESMCVPATEDTLFNHLSEIKTAEGKDFFTCEEITAFQGMGGDLDYAKELASMKDNFGRPFFTGYDAVAFKHAGGTVGYAREFLYAVNADGRFFSGSQLPLFYRLGLKIEDLTKFTDTPKPNALLVYAAHDGELPATRENYGALRTDPAVKLFHDLREAYDIKIVVASVEDEVYAALDSRDDFMFLMLSGHGTQKTLSLGEKDLRFVHAEKDETYKLDTLDYELERHLQHLHPEAIIFLNSCSTAYGGKGADNLANAVAAWAKSREVVAAQEVLSTGKVLDLHPYPFDITLKDREGNNDITYRVTVNP